MPPVMTDELMAELYGGQQGSPQDRNRALDWRYTDYQPVGETYTPLGDTFQPINYQKQQYQQFQYNSPQYESSASMLFGESDNNPYAESPLFKPTGAAEHLFGGSGRTDFLKPTGAADHLFNKSSLGVGGAFWGGELGPEELDRFKPTVSSGGEPIVLPPSRSTVLWKPVSPAMTTVNLPKVEQPLDIEQKETFESIEDMDAEVAEHTKTQKLVQPVKRKRGRPRKYPKVEMVTQKKIRGK